MRVQKLKGRITGALFLALIFTLSVLPSIAFAFTIPDTGQEKCYQEVSPYAQVSCTGTGQDGAYSINPMSYTDNGNGTVTDNVTGLVWQKEVDNKAYTWEAAGTYCDSLTLGGHSDWRLPSKKELLTIVDYSIPYYLSPTINQTYFPNLSRSNYWSSTTCATYDSSSSTAWTVTFSDGSVDDQGKTHSNRSLCVRGRQLSPSFTDNGNGTVTDNVTGLMWQKDDPGQMRWPAALSYCEGLNLGGQSDWRLPNIKELESITDDTKYNPVIDKTYFPKAFASSYWTSTTHYQNYTSYETGWAWTVKFYTGSFASDAKYTY